MNERLERYVSKTNDSKEKQALTPEQEKQLQKEKEQVLMLSKAQRESLKNDVILSYLKDFHNVDISIYPKEIWEKFIQEIKMIFNEFKNFDESMITKLKEIRENMSFWLEYWKSNEYYRNMILWNKIEERIKVLKLFTENINWEKLKIWNTEFNKLDYEIFKNNTINLDKNNSVDIFNKINLKDYKFSLKQTFAEEFKKVIDKSNPKYDLIMADLTRLPQVVWTKWFENLKELKLNNGQTVNLEELYKNYNKNYVEFKNKNKIFEFWNKQMESSDKWFWLDDKKYWVWYDQIKDVYKDKMQDINVENMSLADLVIMMRVLFWIVPVAWDLVSSIDDTIQANAWVNFDWSVQTTWEKVLWYSSPILWVLAIIWVWYGVKVALNSPKYAKVIEAITKVVGKISKTPEILKSIWENQKVMNMMDSMKSFIPWIDKIIDKVKSLENPEWKVKSEVKPQTVEKITQERYLEKLNILSKIPNEIMEHLDNLDVSLFKKEKFNYIYSDVLEKISYKLNYFTSTQIENIKSKIRLYIERKIIVHKYFDDFKDNKKKLLAQHLDIDIWLIEKEVEMKIMWPNIVFIVDPMEFNKIISWWKDYSFNFWGWIFINKWEIKELEWSFIIISWNNNTALMHEFQHSLNWYIMPERFSEMSRLNPLSKAKDEIIAFIKEWALFLTIKESLNSKHYDYFNIQNKDYSELKAKYLTELNKYIDIAERLINKWVSLEQLQITPIQKWYRLDKITKLKVVKTEKIKEFSNGGFAWKIIYEGGIIFEWIFNSQWEIIKGIKKYKNFYEEWVFWIWGKIYTWKWNSFFNFNKTIIDYERDLKYSQLLELLKNN